MSDVVDLESIRDCLRAGLPSPMATCGPDGTPHISYISQVQYLDCERVATSRQSFNRALVHLDASPLSQAIIVRPATGEQFRLDLRHLHTATDGEEFEAMRANLDAIASHTGMGPAFRLRGLDVHRVVRCARVRHASREPERVAAPNPLVPLEQFARRLERRTSYEGATQEVIDALDDLFGFRSAVLIAADEIEPGAGLIGTAASRRRVIVTANLARARAMAAAVNGGDGTGGSPEVALPGSAGARSAAAVPLVVGKDVLGVLYLESAEPSAFGGPTEGLLRIIGAHAAAALAARAPAAEQPRRAPVAAPVPSSEPTIELVYYQADDTVLCDSAYVVKGAPGRILWSMLKAHADSGRTQFSNRELRLDESLGLPAGNDNLEARLLVLRRRLAAIDCGVTLERVGRGRLELQLERPAELTEVPTKLLQRAAHGANGA
ncbi:MAG: adenylate cyclase [Solirubrobacteraceae bacterium]